MALLGKPALTMWWDIAPQLRSDFEDWHSREHFAERLGIPGFSPRLARARIAWRIGQAGADGAAVACCRSRDELRAHLTALVTTLVGRPA